MSDDLPDLTRTSAALAAFDADDADYRERVLATTDQCKLRMIDDQHDLLAREVGVAFGLDTADRNNPDDCARLVRPGPRVPQPGGELSFVRRMVALWREQ